MKRKRTKRGKKRTLRVRIIEARQRDQVNQQTTKSEKLAKRGEKSKGNLLRLSNWYLERYIYIL